MTLHSDHGGIYDGGRHVPERRRPRAYGGCRCDCHRVDSVKHIMPCCYPEDSEDATVDVLPSGEYVLVGVPPIEPFDEPTKSMMDLAALTKWSEDVTQAGIDAIGAERYMELLSMLAERHRRMARIPHIAPVRNLLTDRITGWECRDARNVIGYGHKPEIAFRFWQAGYFKS